MLSRALTLFLVAISTVGVGLWWAWPGKWSIETEVGIAAAPEFIYPYISRLEKWPEWSTADTHGWEKQASEAEHSIHYRVPLQYRSHAELTYTLKFENAPETRAETQADTASAPLTRLRMGMQVDFGLKVLARYAHRHLRDEIRQRFEFEAARLRELAENDAKLAAAQKAADADSISLVPMDTVSTPVQPAE